MIRSLYTLALNVLMKKYTCNDIRENYENEVQEIRCHMFQNYRFIVNYRTLECNNQLHYFSDSPAIILDDIVRGEELFDIGMCDIDF